MFEDVERADDIELIAKRDMPRVHLRELRRGDASRCKPQAGAEDLAAGQFDRRIRGVDPAQHEPGPAADLKERPAIRKVGLQGPDDEVVTSAEPEIVRFQFGKRTEVRLPEALVLEGQVGSESLEPSDRDWPAPAVCAGPRIVAIRSAAGVADLHLPVTVEAP